MKPYSETELGKLYNCDCLDFMKDMPDKSMDLVLTDPPYGINEDGGRFRDRKGGGHRVLEKGNWDNKPPDKKDFELIIRISKNQIIWGGNYFTDKLPVSRGWLYWQKLMGGDFSDGELAWTSFDKVLKEFSYCNKRKGKEHPTQKPIELFMWILNKYSKNSDLIFDPYLGSGTTAIVCEKLNRKWIGIEISEKYCEIAARRIDSEAKQGKLF